EREPVLRCERRDRRGEQRDGTVVERVAVEADAARVREVPGRARQLDGAGGSVEEMTDLFHRAVAGPVAEHERDRPDLTGRAEARVGEEARLRELDRDPGRGLTRDTGHERMPRLGDPRSGEAGDVAPRRFVERAPEVTGGRVAPLVAVEVDPNAGAE